MIHVDEDSPGQGANGFQMVPTPRGSDMMQQDPMVAADPWAGGRPSPPGRVNPLRNAFLDRVEGRADGPLPAQPGHARYCKLRGAEPATFTITERTGCASTGYANDTGSVPPVRRASTLC